MLYIYEWIDTKKNNVKKETVFYGPKIYIWWPDFKGITRGIYIVLNRIEPKAYYVHIENIIRLAYYLSSGIDTFT